MKTVGSRAEVMHGTAKHTSGGLRKQHLTYNKRGKIVSKRTSARAKTKKGVISLKKKKRRSRRRSKRKSGKRKSGKRKSGKRKSGRRKSGRQKTRRHMQVGGESYTSFIITELGGGENGKNFIGARLMIDTYNLPELLMMERKAMYDDYGITDSSLYKQERRALLTILNDSEPGNSLIPGTEMPSEIGCVIGTKWKVCMHAKLTTKPLLSDIRNMAKQYLYDHPDYAIIHAHGKGNCQTFASYMYEKAAKITHPKFRAHNNIVLPCNMSDKEPFVYQIDTNVNDHEVAPDQPNLLWPKGDPDDKVLGIFIIKCGLHAVIVLKIDVSPRSHWFGGVPAYYPPTRLSPLLPPGGSRCSSGKTRDQRPRSPINILNAEVFVNTDTADLVVTTLTIRWQRSGKRGEAEATYVKTWRESTGQYIPNEGAENEEGPPAASVKIETFEVVLYSGKKNVAHVVPWIAPDIEADWCEWLKNDNHYQHKGFGYMFVHPPRETAG